MGHKAQGARHKGTAENLPPYKQGEIFGIEGSPPLLKADLGGFCRIIPRVRSPALKGQTRYALCA